MPASPVGLDDGAPSAPTSTRARDRRAPLPYVRGTTSLIAGAAIGGAFLLVRDTLILGDFVILARIERGNLPDNADLALSATYTISMFTVAPAQIMLAIPAGLVAAGAYQRGRWRGWRQDPAQVPVARLRRRAIAGWALMGLGLATLAADVSAIGYVAEIPLLHQGLSLAGTGLLTTGVAIGPHAAGRLRGYRERRAFTWSVAPLTWHKGGGIGLAGRW